MKSKVKNILIIGISLLIVWVNFWVMELSHQQPKLENTIEVPENAEDVIIINPLLTILPTLEQLISDKRYQATYELLRKQLKASSQETPMDYGIDWTKPLRMVKENASNQLYFLVALNQPKKFEKAIAKGELLGFIYQKQGVIYTGEKPTISGFKQIEYDATKEINWLNQLAQSVTLDIETNRIVIDGLQEIKHVKLLKNVPLAKHFYIQFPMEANRLLDTFPLPKEIKQLASKINQLAVDYEGIEMNQAGFEAKFNAVVSLSDKMTATAMEELLNSVELLRWEKKNNYYQLFFMEQTLFLQQLDAYEWFIGKDISSVTKNQQEIVFALQGKPADLLKIKGNSLLGLGLNFIPGFLPTKEYLNKMENCSIVAKKAGNQLETKGEIRMKNQANFVLETLHFALQLSK